MRDSLVAIRNYSMQLMMEMRTRASKTRMQIVSAYGDMSENEHVILEACDIVLDTFEEMNSREWSAIMYELNLLDGEKYCALDDMLFPDKMEREYIIYAMWNMDKAWEGAL